MRQTIVMICVVSVLCGISCADNDGPGTEADRIGVGASCVTDVDCPQPEDENAPRLVCLQDFSGGYCGLSNCTSNAACPYGSACVTHDNGINYCFRICINKAECNLRRDPAVPSNCSSNIEFVEPQTNIKACVPPSS
jgi:hypothetical protein